MLVASGCRACPPPPAASLAQCSSRQLSARGGEQLTAQLLCPPARQQAGPQQAQLVAVIQQACSLVSREGWSARPAACQTPQQRPAYCMVQRWWKAVVPVCEYCTRIRGDCVSAVLQGLAPPTHGSAAARRPHTAAGSVAPALVENFCRLGARTAAVAASGAAAAAVGGQLGSHLAQRRGQQLQQRGPRLRRCLQGPERVFAGMQ